MCAQARHVGLLTGLPDAYGRGRIIGDYRRAALYGVDRADRGKAEATGTRWAGSRSPNRTIRCAEELSDQIRALKDIVKEWPRRYGFDIARPAENAREAVQWLYFGLPWRASRSRTARR